MIAMPARATFALRLNQRFFYGWLMVAVGAVGIFASGPGQSFIFSIFLTSLSEDLAISQTSISSAYALATLVAAFGLPYVGRAIDRFGVRAVLLLIAALFGLAAISFSRVNSLVVLSVSFMALRFLGQGSLMMSCNNLVAQWFSEKRGFALSLTGLGFSLSVAAYPPLAHWLMEQLGWRQTWIWLGLLSWLLLLPMAWFLVHNKPEDIGLQPDGASDAALPGDHAATTRTAPKRSTTDVGMTLSEALRTSAFWIIAFGVFTLAMLVTSIFFYQVPILESHGLSAQVAANIFPLTAITMIIFMPIQGRLLDRFPTPVMFAWALLLLSGALIAIAFVDDLPSAMIYSVVFGMSNAALHAVYAYVWPRYFGRKHLGSIQGTATMIGVVGASLGPLPLGIAYDLFGSYTSALFLFAAQPLLAAILVLFVKPPKLS
jgi:MFS family permease